MPPGHCPSGPLVTGGMYPLRPYRQDDGREDVYYHEGSLQALRQVDRLPKGGTRGRGKIGRVKDAAQARHEGSFLVGSGSVSVEGPGYPAAAGPDGPRAQAICRHSAYGLLLPMSGAATLTASVQAMTVETLGRRPGPAPLAGMTALVVDDHRESGQAVGHMLEADGARVLVADSGGEALVLIARHRPDVILADLSMPGMDGFEFPRRLRADPQTARLPVVAVTGFGRRCDHLRTGEAGFNAHVGKPVDWTTLIAAVHRCVPRGRPDTAGGLNHGGRVD
jgi:CheY-like chemotaxis protein